MKTPDKKIYKYHKELEKVQSYLDEASFLLLDINFKGGMDEWHKARIMLAQMLQAEVLSQNSDSKEKERI